MSEGGCASRDPDWLLETLQSAVHHARRDSSEATLMRLAQDSLLLHDYLRRDDSPCPCQPSVALKQRSALDLPTSVGPGRASTQHKLASYLHARRTEGTAFQPEPFAAGDDDRRLALDLGEAEAAPARQPGLRRAWLHQAAAGGVFLLIALLALAAVS